MTYQPNRGGHAPGDIREEFADWVEDGMRENDEGRRVTGQLWNCTDIMPRELRADIECQFDRELWTYAQAARAFRSSWA